MQVYAEKYDHKKGNTQVNLPVKQGSYYFEAQ